MNASSLDDARPSTPAADSSHAPWESAEDHVADLMDFVVASPSSYHAAAEVARRLVAAGATLVDEAGPWPSAPGAYVLVRGGAAVAWVVPEDAAGRDAAESAAFRIVGSHTDSPGFRVKPNPDAGAAGYAQVAVEVYGGALLGAWTDREIEFAGRVVTRDGRVHLARTGPVARIPQLAIHLNRGVNDEGLKLDRQRHTTPVIGYAGDAGAFTAMLADAAESPDAPVSADDIVAWDLITCDTQPPRTFGVRGEFLACGRLDNLLSVHASLVAFEHLLADGPAASSSPATAGSGRDIPVLVAFDHEEVGSASTTGAAGPLLEDVLRRIAAAAGADEDGMQRMFRRSTCISADGAHAVHPNYTGEHEPGHWPMLDGGPVLKINANQRYATDAVGQGMFERVTAAAAQEAGETIPVQYFVSSNQKPCGSTIGPITATRLGISTVDAGAAMLSMHSPREMCGVKDPWWLARIIGAYWVGA
ncbi:M18 family aminopeptidase [Corynebacterium freneyi]|uniref:M18 family aminopeptidase n=1 Tax=Corynebacterium freneyi TaxID=134034 RepID=UPI00068ACE03|nr:M18 family aminopeptidase [Corynebacterium freneyi]